MRISGVLPLILTLTLFASARAQAGAQPLNASPSPVPQANEHEYENSRRCSKSIDGLADYYRILGRDTAVLYPDPELNIPPCAVSNQRAAEISALSDELSTLKELESLRRAQLKAGEPNPIALPPPDNGGTTSVRSYYGKYASLFPKYQPQFRELFLSDMTELLKKQVLTVQRPFLTYHWGHRETLDDEWQNTRSPDVPGAAELVRDTIPVYADPKSSYLGNRDGFYVAVDPVSSRKFGGVGDDWILIQLRMHPGVRILEISDAVDTLDEKFRSLVESTRVGRGCWTDFEQLFIHQPLTDECNQLSLDLVAALKTDAILYFYGADTFGECGKPGSLQGALLLTRGGWIRPGDVRFFAPGQKGGKEDRKPVEALLEQKHAEWLWKDIKGKRLPDDSAWRKRNLLHCDTGFARYVSPEEESGAGPLTACPCPWHSISSSISWVGSGRR